MQCEKPLETFFTVDEKLSDDIVIFKSEPTFILNEYPFRDFKSKSPKDRVSFGGFFTTEDRTSFKNVISSFFKTFIPGCHYIIRPSGPYNFENTRYSRSVFYNPASILADRDYLDQPFVGQFFLSAMIEDLDSLTDNWKWLPSFKWSIERVQPIPNKPFTYNTPILSKMMAEDYEEFDNALLYNTYVVQDFNLFRSSRGANGFDLDITTIVKNFRDFNNIDDYANSICKTLTLEPAYTCRLIFPNFFHTAAEQYGKFGEIMLRSSISRKGILITPATCKDLIKGAPFKHLQIDVSNLNPVKVQFSFEKKDDTNDMIVLPFRFLQYVPHGEILNQLDSITVDNYGNDEATKLAVFLGANVLINDFNRKPKV